MRAHRDKCTELKGSVASGSLENDISDSVWFDVELRSTVDQTLVCLNPGTHSWRSGEECLLRPARGMSSGIRRACNH